MSLERIIRSAGAQLTPEQVRCLGNTPQIYDPTGETARRQHARCMGTGADSAGPVEITGAVPLLESTPLADEIRTLAGGYRDFAGNMNALALACTPGPGDSAATLRSKAERYNDGITGLNMWLGLSRDRRTQVIAEQGAAVNELVTIGAQAVAQGNAFIDLANRAANPIDRDNYLAQARAARDVAERAAAQATDLRAALIELGDAVDEFTASMKRARTAGDALWSKLPDEDLTWKGTVQKGIADLSAAIAAMGAGFAQAATVGLVAILGLAALFYFGQRRRGA